MDVYLIRHTTVELESGICYGQSDIGLADTAEAEFESVHEKLPDSLQDFKLYSSPLKRCMQLSATFSESDIQVDDRLMELDFGDWELQKWDDIDDKTFRHWMNDFVHQAPPGGESYQALSERVLQWWNELWDHAPDKVVVITHGGVIRCLISHILGIPLSNSFRLSIDHGSLSAIHRDGCIKSVKFINR